LARNWLRGALGDAMHAVLCGAGHTRLRAFSWVLIGQLALALLISRPAHYGDHETLAA
jgi:IS5 family transposase